MYVFSSEIFASADAAYVLAYSVIMLTTDLHSSQVRIETLNYADPIIRLISLYLNMCQYCALDSV